MKNVSDMTLKELQLASVRLAKYEDVHKRYVEIAAKIKLMGEELVEMAKIIDPLMGVKVRKRSGADYDELVGEVFEKLRSGVQVSVDMIAKSYPDIDKSAHYYIFSKLKKCKGVSVGSVGRKKHLFMR